MRHGRLTASTILCQRLGADRLANCEKSRNLCSIVSALIRAHSVCSKDVTSSDCVTFGTRGCRFESCRARFGITARVVNEPPFVSTLIPNNLGFVNQLIAWS